MIKMITKPRLFRLKCLFEAAAKGLSSSVNVVTPSDGLLVVKRDGNVAHLMTKDCRAAADEWCLPGTLHHCIEQRLNAAV